VIHGLEVRALEVRDLAFDVEGHDLPSSVIRHLVAAGVALEEQAALGGPITFTHDVLIGPDLLSMHRQMKNSRPLFRREIGDALQPSDQRVLVASIHAGKSSKARKKVLLAIRIGSMLCKPASELAFS
jgi:hypothetical protein